MKQFWHDNKLKFLAVIFICFIISSPILAENLIKNGEFEQGLVNNIPKYWGEEYYNSYIEKDRNGHVIKIENKESQMSLGAQTISIDWKKVSKIT